MRKGGFHLALLYIIDGMRSKQFRMRSRLPGHIIQMWSQDNCPIRFFPYTLLFFLIQPVPAANQFADTIPADFYWK